MLTTYGMAGIIMIAPAVGITITVIGGTCDGTWKYMVLWWELKCSICVTFFVHKQGVGYPHGCHVFSGSISILIP